MTSAGRVSRRSGRAASSGWGVAASKRSWPLVVAASSVVLMVAYVHLPTAAAETLFQLCGWTSVGLLWRRTGRLQRSRLPWRLVALGLALFVVGDLWFTINDFVLDNPPVPSGADLAYLAGYLFLPVGLASLIRRANQGRERLAIIDATIIIVPVSVAIWLYLASPFATASDTSWAARASSTAYPIGDLIGAAVVVRPLSSSLTTRRAAQPAIGIITVGLLLMLGADLWYLVAELRGQYTAGGWSDALYIPAYLSFGAAACSPSFAEIDRPAPVVEPRHDVRRLALLGAAALLTPSMLALQWWRGGQMAIPVIVAGTVVTFVLVVARMGHLAESLAESRERLRFEVDHDHLTGLYTRPALLRQLRQLLDDDQPGTLLFVDLDGFKQVNDRLGHAAGDELLQHIAAEIRSCVRSTDIVARLGGDEFVVVLRTDDEIATFNLANRMIERLDLAAGEHERHVQVTASVGLTRWSAGNRTGDAGHLIDEADHAMYRAKRASGNRLVIVPAVGEPTPPTCLTCLTCRAVSGRPRPGSARAGCRRARRAGRARGSCAGRSSAP